jgi:subtilisin
MKSRLALAALLLSVAVVPTSAAGQPPAAGEPVYRIPPGELVPTLMEAIPLDAEEVDWGHAALAAPECWKATRGKGVKVAVLDTGCDLQHVDLKGQVVASKDFTGSRNGVSDVQGHGTFCAGEIAAAQNGVGVVGFAPDASLIIAKVLGDGGSGATSWINAGGDWAVAQGADVLSLSLGGPSADAQSAAAVKRWTAAGVIVVCAAGNEGPGNNTVGYPGGFPEVVCVGAVDANLAVARFSSRGSPLFACAPGVNVRSSYPGNRKATMSGTSMATPYVAAVAALWVASHPEVPKADRPAAFKKSLQEMARDLGPAGRDTAYGYGFAQPVKMLGPAQPVPPTPVPPSPGTGLTGTLTYQDGKLVAATPGAVAPPKPPVVGDTHEIDLSGIGPIRRALVKRKILNLIEDNEVADFEIKGDKVILVRKAGVDWDKFFAFLEKLIPLILKIIDLFGGLNEPQSVLPGRGEVREYGGG